jgi:hypothetical protein
LGEVKINHRIALRHDDPIWRDVEATGVSIDRGNDIIWVANVTEDDPAWSEVRLLMLERPHSELVTNIFTKHEFDAAEWLVLEALGQHGYPEPDIDYHSATDDLADYCPICGIGGVQNASFRLRAEPKASHSQFVQLNWVFDEFFLREPAREGLLVAGITGIDFLAPVLHKNGRPSEQIMQMTIQTVLPQALDSTSLEPVTCKEENEEWESELWLRKMRPSPAETHPYCGRVKYHHMHRGPFRFARDAVADASDVVKSHEWFGSGGSAFQLVMVSQRFRQVVVAAKWRGVKFEPIELVG